MVADVTVLDGMVVYEHSFQRLKRIVLLPVTFNQLSYDIKVPKSQRCYWLPLFAKEMHTNGNQTVDVKTVSGD